MKSFMKLFPVLLAAVLYASVPLTASSDKEKDKDKEGGKEHRGHDDRGEGHNHVPSVITITQNGGGTVSGPTSVPWDEDAVYHIVPDFGFTFVLTVDGVAKGTFNAPLTFELEDGKGPHTVDVLFIGETST
jgi:hypothetical protein